MDRKKQEKPQARRDGDGTLRGSVHGSQGSAEGASSETSNSNAAEAGERTIQEETGGVGAEEKVLAKVVVGMAFARSRTFTAKPCTSCAALREQDTNFTRVYATRGDVRYCRCHFCGSTWKDSDSVPHSGS